MTSTKFITIKTFYAIGSTEMILTIIKSVTFKYENHVSPTQPLLLGHMHFLVDRNIPSVKKNVE